MHSRGVHHKPPLAPRREAYVVRVLSDIDESDFVSPL